MTRERPGHRPNELESSEQENGIKVTDFVNHTGEYIEEHDLNPDDIPGDLEFEHLTMEGNGSVRIKGEESEEAEDERQKLINKINQDSTTIHRLPNGKIRIEESDEEMPEEPSLPDTEGYDKIKT